MEDDPNHLYWLDGVVRIASTIHLESHRCINTMRWQHCILLDDRIVLRHLVSCRMGADDETVRRYAHAYIMMLLSTQLFGVKSGTRLHICWLPYVARLEDMVGGLLHCHGYSGACRVANKNVIKLADPLQLLQSWIFRRFPGFWLDEFDVFYWPLASRYSSFNYASSF
ncbi:hypothetical protein Ahy_A03g014342 [Arachis hypogaea]|uniref:Aminotransferase-like plant mobile domain-containing protein n=1 Tax=Arachis hypogaea TaxID=3818 RepID=A0A445DXJ1_ARAHY|nr:hypothetical protein Ahy_A03g014342 [Arachis hypogaea]